MTKNPTIYLVIPIVLALLAGGWLDQKFATEPFIMLFLVGAAFAFSINALNKQ